MDHREVTAEQIADLKRRIKKRQDEVWDGRGELTADDVDQVIDFWFEDLERP